MLGLRVLLFAAPVAGVLLHDQKFLAIQRPDDERPPAGNERPPAGNERPPPRDEQTASGDERPPAGKERPPAGGERPPPRDEQTASGDERPPAGEVPADSTERAVAEAYDAEDAGASGSAMDGSRPLPDDRRPEVPSDPTARAVAEAKDAEDAGASGPSDKYQAKQQCVKQCKADNKGKKNKTARKACIEECKTTHA